MKHPEGRPGQSSRPSNTRPGTSRYKRAANGKLTQQTKILHAMLIKTSEYHLTANK